MILRALEFAHSDDPLDLEDDNNTVSENEESSSCWSLWNFDAISNVVNAFYAALTNKEVSGVVATLMTWMGVLT